MLNTTYVLNDMQELFPGLPKPKNTKQIEAQMAIPAKDWEDVDMGLMNLQHVYLHMRREKYDKTL
jgi:hypothetical protein